VCPVCLLDFVDVDVDLPCRAACENAAKGWELWNSGDRAEAISKFAAAMRGSHELAHKFKIVSRSSQCQHQPCDIVCFPRVCVQATLQRYTAGEEVYTAEGESDAVLAAWALNEPKKFVAVSSEDSDMQSYLVPNVIIKLNRETGECKLLNIDALHKLKLFEGLNQLEVRCSRCIVS
jgi:hypothetical protein